MPSLHRCTCIARSLDPRFQERGFAPIIVGVRSDPLLEQPVTIIMRGGRVGRGAHVHPHRAGEVLAVRARDLVRVRVRLRLRLRLRLRVWVRLRLRVIPGLPGMPTRGRLPPSVLARCSSSVASHCHGSGEDRRLG